MRFSGQIPTDQVTRGAELLGAPAIGELARALEGAGFDAGYMTEHPFPPDAWLRAGGHHALDPFVALAVAAARHAAAAPAHQHPGAAVSEPVPARRRRSRAWMWCRADG